DGEERERPDRGRGDGEERERPEPPARGEPDCESIRERLDAAIEAGRISPEDAEARFASVCGEGDEDDADADEAEEADDAEDADEAEEADEAGDEAAPGDDAEGEAAGVANPHDASFIRGDVNEDKVIDISDSVAVISYLFLGEVRPYCMDSADANDDGSVDISDTLRILSHLFNGGGPLPQPFPSRGFDSTVDDLFCDEAAF
ncbi:MAG: dockerin type I repeat-containing protein, partial [Planctomycetota bacterium]|nr:dockerin type I repeat-containing protein [Planctomycetota bacterium]